MFTITVMEFVALIAVVGAIVIGLRYTEAMLRQSHELRESRKLIGNFYYEFVDMMKKAMEELS